VLSRDLVWALLVGAAVGVSPHTSGARPIPKIVGGIAAAALVLGYRVLTRRRSRETAAEGGETRPLLSRPPAAVCAVLLLFCAVFAPTVVWMYGEWTESIWRNGHGLIVPFIMFVLARSILRRDAGGDDGASPWGFPFVFAGLILAVAGSAAPLQNLSALGLAVCLPGLSLLLLGARRTKVLAPPLCLGLLLVPIPTSLASQVYLPVASAVGAKSMLGLLGVPVVTKATTLTMTGGIWFVSDRCSGFSALVPALGASVFLAVYSKSLLRRVALLLCPWPLVAVLNSLRTLVFSAYLEYSGTNLLHTPLHGLSGIVTFWAVMGAVFLMADRRTLREALG
jgi:exosortase